MNRFLVFAALVSPLLAPAASTAPAAPAAKPPGFLLGVSAGALVPFNKLAASVAGTLEAGLLVRWTGQELGGSLGVTYNQPAASGGVTDPRVPGGSYQWNVRQRSLVVTPALFYRMTTLGSVVPYGSLGPRFSFMDQSGSGTADTAALGTTVETLARVGVAGRVGAELLVGPGGLTIEALVEWAPLGSVTAGAGTSLSGVTAQVGYRLVL